MFSHDSLRGVTLPGAVYGSPHFIMEKYIKSHEHTYIAGTIGDECDICGLLKSTIENIERKPEEVKVKNCVQCHQKMERSYGNEEWCAPFCENMECANYRLLQVGV